MRIALLITGFILTSTVVGFGQVRTVTNVDLEKFQQRRVAAEREYRENYKRLGLPSPEELDKQRDEDMKARLQLAEQLRQARLEEERLDLERRSIEIESERIIDTDSEVYQSGGYYYGGGLLIGGGTFDSRRGRGRHRGRFANRGGYRITPFQVIPVPRQPRTQPALIRRGRRH